MPGGRQIPAKPHSQGQDICRTAAGSAHLRLPVQRSLALPVIRAAVAVYDLGVRRSLWKVFHGPRACAALPRSPGCK